MKKITLLFFLSMLCVIGTSWSQNADVLGSPNGTANFSESASFAAPISHPFPNNTEMIPCDGVLTDYVNNTTPGAGIASQIFPDFGNSTLQSADDFVPPADAVICEVDIIGQFFNSTTNTLDDPSISIRMTIYDDAAGQPGSVIYTEDFPGSIAGPGNPSFTLSPTAVPNLTGGTTYWLSVQPIMAFGTFGQWGWVETGDNNGNQRQFQDPDGLIGNPCVSWGDAVSTCGVGTQPDLAMEISFNAPGVPPIIMCPADVMINTDPGLCTGIPNFTDAVAIDPEGGTVTVTQTMGPATGTPFPLGDTIIEFTATNDSPPFETATCQFTVTVLDNQPPVVTCPADITVDSDPGICGAVVTYPDPTVVDNCFNSGGMTTTGQVLFPGAANPFTANLTRGYWFVAPVDFKMTAIRVPTDVSTGDQSIQVMRMDGAPPAFPGTNNYLDLLFYTGLDTNSGYIPVDIDFVAGDVVGILGVRGTNNTNAYSTQATIDIDGNTVDIRRFGTQNAITGGAAPQGSFWTEGGATANKSEVEFDYQIGTAPQPVPYTVVTGFPSGGTFPVGTTLTTLEYTDPGGNAVQCTFNVTVNDIEAPTVSCIGTPGPAVGSTGDTPALPIPDSDPAGISTTITVADVGTVLDMNVDLDIEHTWVGDLIVTLESPAGTSITMIDRMGAPPGTFGCSNNDLLVTLDDEATLPIEDECSGSPITGSFTPNEALSAFDGEDVNGDWILTVSDNAGGDTGTINGWTLNYDYDSPGIPLDIVLDANGMASIAASALITGVNDNCGPGGVTITGGVDSPAPFTLPTTLAGGNGNFGNMFDINALNDVTIQSFDIHGDTGATFDVEVYAKSGTWVGSEDNPAAWTLIGTAPGVVSNGDGVETPLNLTLGYTIPAGETHAFYVTPTDFSTGGFNYTNGTATGNVFASDANIEFLEGAGKGYPFSGTTF
ncbi:HYR domain-containing protein, partial [Aureitalea sp. L0-47]|uniref:HYR domain-containing protein n=1 Tax=Aureitalea sp. L0-47 TaxID=2816962 RepID=UPI002238AC26